tara:strand:- start:1351 stop:1575 length:225 start_codon:yes stop_codon:yes gene_type:complete
LKVSIKQRAANLFSMLHKSKDYCYSFNKLVYGLFLDIFEDENLYLVVSHGKGIYIYKISTIKLAHMRAGGYIEL